MTRFGLTAAAAVFAALPAAAQNTAPTTADECIERWTNFEQLAAQMADIPGTVTVELDDGILEQLVAMCETSTGTRSGLRNHTEATFSRDNFTLNFK